MATSCSHYFRETVEGAERAGLNGDRLLANVGLSRAEVYDPTWRGDVELLSRMVQFLWRDLDDEFMGFVSTPAKPGTFAMMTNVIIQSPSLEPALRKAVLFYELVNDGIRMSVERRGEVVVFSVTFAEPELDPANYFLEFWLTIWCRLLGWLAGRPVPLQHATFAYPYPKRYGEEFKHMFPCGHTFDARVTSLHFDGDFMKLPIVRSKEELKDFLTVAPVGFMAMPSEDKSWARRVRTYLLSEARLPLELAPFETVSSDLHVTPATLRRRLKQEGTSYRAIKETIRRDLAIRKIIESRISIQHLSHLLGYSEPRAFTRAFKQWTGLSPINYREQFTS